MQVDLNNYSKANAAENSRLDTVPTVKPFPHEGKVRAKQAAPFLGVGLSTFWLYVKQGRIDRPMRYGARVSVWDASYIRSLAENGIPEAKSLSDGKGVAHD